MGLITWHQKHFHKWASCTSWSCSSNHCNNSRFPSFARYSDCLVVLIYQQPSTWIWWKVRVLCVECWEIHPCTHTYCRRTAAIVLLCHNVNKTCPLISSNVVIRGPGWRCYSTNICKAMHHLRPCRSLYEACDAERLPPLPPANVNYHISSWHLSVMPNMRYVKSVSLWKRWTGGCWWLRSCRQIHNKACLLIRDSWGLSTSQ